MKKALLVGINYIGTPNQLSGCINDTENIKAELVGADVQVRILTDAKGNSKENLPTRANILAGLNWLVKSTAGDSLLFQYSGHGTQVRDTSGDEISGEDDAICPLDFDSAGFIIDDDLRVILAQIPAGVSLFVVMDCCHSGTNLDLKYLYTNTGGRIKQQTFKYAELAADIVAISGCKDEQTSADTVEPNALTNKWQSQGALTYGITTVIKKYQDLKPVKRLTWRRLLLGICEEIAGYQQIPQIGSNKKLNIDDPVRILQPEDGEKSLCNVM